MLAKKSRNPILNANSTEIGAVSYYILDRIVQAKVTEDSLSVDLEDGRTISVPPGWFPRLVHGTPAERVNSEIAGQGLVSIGPIEIEPVEQERVAKNRSKS